MICATAGNTLANAFPVRIDKNSLVNELKKVIKAEIPQTFANVDVKDIKLWKVEIPLSNFSLEENEELRTTRVDHHFSFERDIGIKGTTCLITGITQHAFDVAVSPKRTKASSGP
ncbi:hypothetical protein GLOIN_2v1736381 [Rhizophagus irregularis DAOM 181602=DAOM 197198]|nr:hypothetical protein GLOIN_2v1736381 [Rhizophagus irregularis DAOM 181602=DAOM 197198]